MSGPRPPPPLPPAREVPASSDLDRLHDDCRRGHLEPVEALVTDSSALVNQPGNLGFTALMWASQTGHIDIVELLLKKGASVPAQNQNGDSALHLAAWKGHADVVRALLAAKAPLDLRNRDGKQPGDLARGADVKTLLEQAMPAGVINVVQDDDDDDSDDE